TGSTLFHKRDPRVKLIGTAAISLVLALCTSFLVAGTGCIVTGALLILSRPDFRLLLKRMININIFTLFMWLTLPLTYGGNELLTLSFLKLSMDGIRMAALITLKTNGIFFCFLALLATSTTANLGHAMEKLGIPQKLIFLLLFSYRQLFVIHQEYHRLQRAAKLRGFTPANSLHTYRTYSHMFGMTLVKSWNRAERVHQAMILRGFNGKLIPLSQPQPGKDDYLFLIMLLLISLLLAGLSLLPL
ncbi:MAG: cobalt ECF transporter T component CbiQ, partial [Thermodesulfobacteriota bacterium]|nr:cobalt ECF transporter T component CbiQ [Thermodesulfobacteriota bacterium]